jgi:hypothetical protein
MATLVEETVAALNQLADAADEAVAAGATVTIPPALREACAMIVALADTGATSTMTRMVVTMPLRRMLWHVLEPGEQFTVAQVVALLEQRGASWPANKVSNALGYWVDRGRMVRVTQGVYKWPN